MNHFCRITAGLLIAVCLLPGVEIRINPEIEQVAPFSTFELDVEVVGVNNLYAYQFDLTFDPAVLQLNSATEGGFLPAVGSTLFVAPAIDNAAGTATLLASTLTGLSSGASGDGILGVLSFTAAGSGSSSVTLSNVVLLDENLGTIFTTVTTGTVTVVPEPASGIPVGLVLAAAVLRWRARQISPQ